MNIFLQGLVLGFSIAAPIGPIGLLCIRRTLAYGRLSGFVSGLGAAAADALYGAVAGFGLTFISNFLLTHKNVIQLFGGLFLCYLAITTFLSKTSTAVQELKNGNLFVDFVSTFALTITNPMTILSFIAVFTGFSMTSSTQDYFSAIMLVNGIFIGCSLWWFILSSVIGFLRTSLTAQNMTLINRCSGLIIFAFGFYLLINIVR